MSKGWLKISIIVLFSAVFISGCTVILGIIAARGDQPTALLITVESDPPGADIYLNDRKLGKAPLTITIEGLSKEHKIVFIKNGYQTKIETVSISPGRRLDEKYLSVIKPDGTSLQIGDRTLNVVLEKEIAAP